MLSLTCTSLTVQVLVTSELKVIIPNLQPGTTYNVTLTANRGDQTSDIVWDTDTTGEA